MIYLDNNATTPIDPEVLDAMLPYLKEEYGNPSSRYYTLAQNAEKAVENARENVASLINANPNEIIFTSGATESNNFIIKGVADYQKYYSEQGNHIITSTVEHKSIIQTCEYLSGNIFYNRNSNTATTRYLKPKVDNKKIDRGYEVTFLPVNQYGQVNIKDFRNNIKVNTILSSFIWGNNEIGSLNNIKELADLAHSNNVLFHSDATQVMGRININCKNVAVDFLSFSAHKLYGPKGVGAAFIRQGSLPYKITSLLHGGKQEFGYRAGTSAVHNIVGFGKCCEIARRDFEKITKHLSLLEEQAKKDLKSRHPEITFLGDPIQHVPGVVSVMIPGIINELLIKQLSDTIAISSGSACGIGEPSYVIKEIGLESKSSNFIRLSFNKYNDSSFKAEF